MITEPKLERRKKQNYVAIRMAVPIPFGKYLKPAWDEVYDWLKAKGIKTFRSFHHPLSHHRYV